MFIFINLYSNNKNGLQSCLNFINKLNQNNKLKIKLFWVKQQKTISYKLVTVLKSPHVNKKAQEHFETCIYQSRLKLYTFQVKKLKFILKKIKYKLFPDIFIKTKIILFKFELQKYKQKIISPNRFLIEPSKKLLTINLTPYLKIFDIFGQLCTRNLK